MCALICVALDLQRLFGLRVLAPPLHWSGVNVNKLSTLKNAPANASHDCFRYSAVNGLTFWDEIEIRALKYDS